MTMKASRNSMKPTTCSAFSACHFFANNTAATNALCDTALAVSFFVLSCGFTFQVEPRFL